MGTYRAERVALPQDPTDPRLRAQVREWIRVLEPARPPTDEAVEERFARGVPSAWWRFPWRETTIQLLDEAAFREVRESRNRYKITREEATRLRGARIAVLGLSVGQAILVTLAMEGIGGTLRFSDPDTLDLSNLNRLRASVLDLGTPKWVLAARALAELDPYLRLEVMPEAVTPATIAAFLDGVDLLVEECDDLEVKLRVREAARARGIPVVMHTSDRGLLDVERFDQEPERPLFHGLVGAMDAAALAGLSPADKVPVIARILGTPSLRSAVTLPEVGLTVVSWPQLAAEVSAGAASVTEVVRRILLGAPIPSGRWVMDPAEGFAAEPLYRTPVPAPPPAPLLLPPGLPSPDDAVAYVVTAASLAPSAHNAQPWRFVALGDQIEGHRDPTHWNSRLDHDGQLFDAMLGSALENLVVAASAIGRGVRVELDTGDHAWTATLEGSCEADPLAVAIGARHTNRRMPDPRPIAADTLLALQAEAERFGCTLRCTTPDAELGAACAAAMRTVALEPALHAEMMETLRWSPEEAAATRDGLDVDTLELDGAQRIGLRLFTQPSVARAAGALGIGRRIGVDIGDNVARAPLAGLLVLPGRDRASNIAGGRALQRVWLRATTAGLSVYPLAALCQLWAYGRAGGLSHARMEELRAHRQAWSRHFGVGDEDAELILLRFAWCPPASARSLRRGLPSILTRR